MKKYSALMLCCCESCLRYEIDRMLGHLYGHYIPFGQPVYEVIETSCCTVTFMLESSRLRGLRFDAVTTCGNCTEKAMDIAATLRR